MKVYEVKETCLREVNTKQWLGLLKYSARNNNSVIHTTYVHFVHENKVLIITLLRTTVTLVPTSYLL